MSAADQDRPPNGSAAARPQNGDSGERSRSSLLLVEGEPPSRGELALLLDRYELTMAASYLRRGLNGTAVFELFVRTLPARRPWLLFAGLQPALALLATISFGRREVRYLAQLGYPDALCHYLSGLHFSGTVEAVPEGTVVFAGEPLVRVVAPRVEGQLAETLLLNQITFQTAIATKAARVVLAAGGGEVGAGERVYDYSARRDHGTDAALKVARAAYIAGAGGTSNVAAALRYGIPAVGTMAHSYVLSFAGEREAFEAFLEDNPESAVLLVDTYNPLEGVRNAITASRATGVPLKGIRIDSGDRLALAQEARRLLDEAGMGGTEVVASGDLEERQILRLVRAGAPINRYGVGTELGVSRDQPTLAGVYKLVAERRGAGWREVAKRSLEKETVPGVKEVVRVEREGLLVEDLVVRAAEAKELCGGNEGGERRRLLVPYLVEGEPVGFEGLGPIRERARRELAKVPPHLRLPEEDPPPFPVRLAGSLAEPVAP